jgi:hypothetical protein
MVFSHKNGGINLVKEILKMLNEEHDNVKQLLEKSVKEETKDYFKELKDEMFT